MAEADLAASVLAALDGVFAKSAAERGSPDDIRRLVGVRRLGRGLPLASGADPAPSA